MILSAIALPRSIRTRVPCPSFGSVFNTLCSTETHYQKLAEEHGCSTTDTCRRLMAVTVDGWEQYVGGRVDRLSAYALGNDSEYDSEGSIQFFFFSFFFFSSTWCNPTSSTIFF